VLHPFPVLVSSKGDTYEIRLPFIAERPFHGQSLASLNDDAAVYLMERVFEDQQSNLPRYLYCPDTFLRRIRVAVTFRDKQTWSGRLSVVLRRWPDEKFLEATLPRLGTMRFAVDGTADLELTVARWLRAEAGKDSEALRARLEHAKSRASEYLDLLEVDLELPTILPRTVRARRSTEQEPSARKRARKRRETQPTTLRVVATNLVHRVLDGRGHAVVARDAIVEELARRIVESGTQLLLVGPSGAGKSAIIEAVIARLTAAESRLHARRDAWLVDANRIISGMSIVGQWQARCAQLAHEVSARGDILVVDDLASLVWAGRTRNEDTNVAQFLESHIASGEVRILAECTAERLEAARELAPSFFAHFHTIVVPALDETTALRVIVQRVREIERASIAAGAAARVRFDTTIPQAVLGLTQRFSAGGALPGSAIRLLEQLATEGNPTERDDDERLILDRKVLVDVVSAQTGLPRFVLWEEAGRKHGETHDYFARRVIAQPQASAAVAELVTSLQQGLNDPHKPIGSLLLVGPTGVGKTETAKALAEYLFGSAKRMLRFDMSEMQDAHAAGRLFGDAHRPDGELTRSIRQQPFAVVLLDEIEKAHPIVFDTLLALLDEGRLTSADGRTADFCNTVVLMTSNLGVREAESGIGFSGPEGEQRDTHYLSAVRAFFRPEFFNRIDQVVTFGSLPRSAIKPLVERIILDLMGRRGMSRSGVLVEIDDGLVDVLATRGFDPRYGARALRRVAEEQLVVPLARHLVSVPSECATLVSLYRSGDAVDIEMWPLPEPERTAPPTPAVAADIGALRAQFAGLGDRLESEHASINHVRDTYSTLLALFNAKQLDNKTWPRFEVASDLVVWLDDLQQRMRVFHDLELSPGKYMPRLEVDKRSSKRWDGNASPVAIIADTPTDHSATRPSRAITQSVHRYARDLGVLLHRARTIDAPVSTAIIRLLPCTRAPQSIQLAETLWRAYAQAWAGWGQLDTLLCRGGTWTPIQTTAAERRDPDVPISGFAVRLSGPGIDDVVSSELGFHLSSRFSGPDVVNGLVRVEQLDTEARAIEHLTELDQQYAAFVAARTLGQSPMGPNLRGALPLRRVFHQGTAVDPATGLELQIDDPNIGECLATRLSQRGERP